MPTKEQLGQIWESQFEFPETRATDDPMYKAPAPNAPVQEEKGDCSKHKKEVAGISDMKVLAESIGDLHYETLAEFLLELSGKFLVDSGKDWAHDRLKLSKQLSKAHALLHQAYFNIHDAWEISKPFMQQ
jgi:hypothetical protein